MWPRRSGLRRAPRGSSSPSQSGRGGAGGLLGGKPAYGDQKKAVALLAKYTVQIAEALRLEAMKKEPGLVVTAKVYGVAPSHRQRVVALVDADVRPENQGGTSDPRDFQSRVRIASGPNAAP